MANIKNTNIRFNLDKPIYKSAWIYLQSADKSEYSSHSLLVATALNEFFERRMKIKADPLLESRERDERLIGEIVGSVKAELEKYIPVYLAGLSGAIKFSPVQSADIQSEPMDNRDAFETADISDDSETMKFLGY